MKHPSQEKIDDYVEDALSAAESEQIGEHLMQCRKCRDKIHAADQPTSEDNGDGNQS